MRVTNPPRYTGLLPEIEALRAEVERLQSKLDLCTKQWNQDLEESAKEIEALKRERDAWQKNAQEWQESYLRTANVSSECAGGPRTLEREVASLREALRLSRNCVSDLRGGFALYVDPMRWVDELVAHIDAALAQSPASPEPMSGAAYAVDRLLREEKAREALEAASPSVDKPACGYCRGIGYQGGGLCLACNGTGRAQEAKP